MKDLYNLTMPISEFSYISGVTRQTLIFYDKLGLLTPAFRTPNGYRYYFPEQKDRVTAIRFLQTAGMSLDEIKTYIDTRTAAHSLQLYDQWADALNQKIRELQQNLELIRCRQQSIRLALQVYHNNVYLEQMPPFCILKSEQVPENATPEQMYHILGKHIVRMHELEVHNILPAHAMTDPNGCYHKNGNTFYRYYYSRPDTALPADAQTEEIPGGNFLVLYVKGDYRLTYQHYGKLFSYAKENNLKPKGYIFEESLIDETVEKNPDELVTKIFIRVTQETS